MANKDDFVEEKDELTQLETTLIGLRREAIDARAASGVEARWRMDLDAYHGRDMGSNSSFVETAAASTAGVAQTGNKRDQQPVRATVFVQLTRQKTNAGAARLADMLFPTDDRNWLLRPTPKPELLKLMRNQPDAGIAGPDGQPLMHPDDPNRPLRMHEVVQDQSNEAASKAEAMQLAIDDLFNECHFNEVGRRVIADAAKFGTGIIKGPHVINRTRRAWTKKPGGGYEQIISEVRRPVSVRVNPWNFYPDPACGDDHQNGAYIWELDRIGRRKLRHLARIPGYRADVIRQALQEGPASPVSSDAIRSPEPYSQGTEINKLFELWTFVGELSKQELIDEGVTDVKVDEKDPTDALRSVKAVVVMVNDKIVRVMLDPLDLGDYQYDVYCWERIDESPFGVGIPYLMRYAQRTLNAAWRTMLDNMAVSFGPQIVMKQGAVVPVDGSLTIVGRKLWALTEAIDIDKVFRVFNIDSNQQDLQNIIEMSLKFADEETSLPMLAQGERGTAPDRVGVAQILMNAANVVLRRLVKDYDDRITKPHVRRYYDWLMTFSEDESIKGDFEVDARGSTALMIREAQQQDMLELLKLSEDPRFAKYIDDHKLVKRLLEAKRMNDIMRSDNDIKIMEAKQKEQPAPVPIPVQVAQVRAQGEIMKTKIDTQSEAVNQQLRNQDAEQARAAQQHLEELKYQAMLLKYANDQKLTLQQVKAQLADTVIKTNSAEAIAAANLAAKGRTEAANRMLTNPQE